MILVFLLILPLSYAATDYNTTGGGNYFNTAGSGLFDDDVDAVVTSNNVGDPSLVPLVSDLNGDGVAEIIVKDGNNIKLFNGKSLNLVSSYSVGASELSNMVASDIDRDGFPELIVARSSNKDILILNYTSAGFVNQTSFYFGDQATQYNNGELLIECGSTDDCDRSVNPSCSRSCMLAASPLLTSNATAISLEAIRFNATNLGVKVSPATVTTPLCFAQIRKMAYEDYNQDGNKDYIVSVLNTKAGASDNLIFVYAITPNRNGSSTVNTVVSNYDILQAGTANSCLNGYSRWFTSPLVMQAIPQGHFEIIIGIMETTSKFSLTVFDSSGSTENNHPELLTADGMIVSNPMKIDAFPDDKTGVADERNDYCVLGYSNSSNAPYLDLLCGSSVNTYAALETIEYFYDYSGTFNISNNYLNNEVLVHAVDIIENSELEIENNVMDNVLNAYGAFRLTIDRCPNCSNAFVQCGLGLGNYCEMERMYEIPHRNAVVIPVDTAREGFEDLILLTSTNVYYVDDGYSNTAPIVCPDDDDCRVDPCNSIKLNQTVQVRVRATDDDSSDLVKYSIIAYEGDANQQTSETANITSGQFATLTFKANQTGSGSLRIRATDTFDPTGHIVSYAVQSFSVSADGFEVGDCVNNFAGTSGNDTSAVSEDGNFSLTPSENNVAVQVLAEVNSLLGVGVIVIWLGIMILFNIWVLVSRDGKDLTGGLSHKFLYMILLILDGGWIIIGAILTVISFWVVLLMLILFIGAIVLFAVNKINTQGAG